MIVSKGISILVNQGPITLLSRGIEWLKRTSLRKVLELKSAVFNNQIIRINNIYLDLDHDIISKNMRKIIREKRYEEPETQSIQTYIRSDYPVIDIGAGIGYTTCLAERVTDDVQIIAIEAVGSLIPVLKRNRELNDGKYSIKHGAYSASSEEIDFYVADDFWSSSSLIRNKKNQQKISVPAMSLDMICSIHEITGPFQLIVDIEGGEHDLLTEEIDLLVESCAVLIIEFHSFAKKESKTYDRILLERGFNCVEKNGQVRTYINERIL